jgi:hypothetical protein
MDAMQSDAAPGRRRVIAALAVAAVVLCLFPPLQWWLADGDKAVTLAYFMLSGLFVVGSVVAIARLDDESEEER